MRSYGKVVYGGGHWKITAEPHVILRLKNNFPRALKTERGTMTLAHNDEVCRDIEWFLSRWKLDVDPKTLARLKRGSRRHEDAILRLEQIIDPDYKPREFKLALPARDYQSRAAEIFLASGSLLLADDVGLGKTVEALCALTDPRTLPAVVVTLSGRMPWQWEEKCRQFLPGATVHVVTKGQPYELPKFMGRGPDILILNYHKLAGWADTLAGYVKTVVYDEVQELRRSQSQRYTGASIVSAAAKFRLGLSATPIYNYGGEIWNVVEALRPGCLGEHAEFVREWCTGYSRSYVIDDPKAFGTYLRENFIMLRRTRAEVGRELPPLQKIVQPVDMDKEPLDAIEDAAAELANIILSDHALARGDRMQAADELDWKLRHATGVGKAPHVADFVRILVENGERVLVYGWHRAVYDIWAKRLEDYRPAMFTGEESPSQKAESFRRFVKGETPVLLMSLRAGAGLDGLQDVCRTVVIGELDWSPGVMEQCVGRVFRDGQREPVAAYFMLSDGGSDPVVAETCGVKREQVEGIKDPQRGLVQDLQSGAGRSQSLAKYYLKKIGRAGRPHAAGPEDAVPSAAHVPG